MRNLITQLENDNQIRIKESIKRFESELKESDKITQTEKYTLNRKTIYKKNREHQVKNRLIEIRNKRLKESYDKIKEVMNASDKLSNDLVITINFYKSNTWGWCPKGNDNYGNVTSSITGCGYCKESTATAQLLNQNLTILKKLYKSKNKKVNCDKKNNDVLGYGSGYGILPSFEGGVGLSCHISILESLGYKVIQSGNNSTTVLIISEPQYQRKNKGVK